MSFLLNPSGLRAPTDEFIQTIDIDPIPFTTAAIRRNFSLEFGLVIKEMRIVNDDPTNSVTVNLHSRNGASRTVPPSSDLTLKQWVSEFHVTPNAGTGVGLIEIAAVEPVNARRKR